MDLATLVKDAPERCGVYIFKGKKEPIYIGKAKNIRKRLLQHLKLSESDPKELAMVKEATGVEWIITTSEFEALVLEIDLIQSYKPRYNTLHKYGGGYPMLMLTEGPYPTVKVVRGAVQGSSIFGPFLQASKAGKVKKLVHKLFRLRTCDPMPLRTEPCMDYHLGLCCGPCAGLVSEEEYNLYVEGAKAFLSGEVGDILPQLYEKIEEFSKERLFEKCAHIRDQIKALENVARGQGVSGLPYRSADLFYRLGWRVGLFLLRGGRLVGKKVYELEREGDAEELVLGYYYSNRVPEVVLTNFSLSEDSMRWIRERSGTRVSFSEDVPASLISLAEENMKEGIDVGVLEKEFREKLGMPAPVVIEGFDISHLGGEYTVGSCVVWERGRMNKKRYRRYRIRSVSGIDDYEALREVLSRRAKRLKEGKEVMPCVWLIDGGKGQLNVALFVKRHFNLSMKVFAIAKREEILLTEDGRELKLREETALYQVFGLIRDEAHRFALSYSRRLRGKGALEDVLTRVRGVGKVRREIIYRNFGSLYEFVEADEERLRKIGIPPALKQEVLKLLYGEV